MANEEKDKLTLHDPPPTGGSLAERHKIGGSKLHQRVAAAPLAAQPSVQTPVLHQKPTQAKNPYDASLEMPNRIGMMLDGSSSMGERCPDNKSKINHLKDACRDFIQTCDFSNTAIAIETFPDEVEEEEEDYYRPKVEDDPLAHLLPQQPQAQIPGNRKRGTSRRRGLCNVEPFLEADINDLTACGGTPMAPAMERALTRNSLTRGIIVSDGEADSPRHAEDVAKMWREADIPIDCVHIGAGASGEELLKKIAEITGGMYIKFDNIANFAKNFKYLTPALRFQLTSGSAGMLGAKEVKS